MHTTSVLGAAANEDRLASGLNAVASMVLRQPQCDGRSPRIEPIARFGLIEGSHHTLEHCPLAGVLRPFLHASIGTD